MPKGLIVMPVQYAFEPQAQRADVQIFDESFWQVSLRRTEISLAAFARQKVVPRYKEDGDNHDATRELTLADRCLAAAFQVDVPSVDGLVDLFRNPPPAAPVRRPEGPSQFPVVEGLPVADAAPSAILSGGEGGSGTDDGRQWLAGFARRGAGYEHRRADAIEHGITSGMSGNEIEKHLDNGAHRDARRCARLWTMVATQLELGVAEFKGFRRDHKTDEDGDPKEIIRLQWSRNLRNPDTPILILDATADRVILERFAGRGIAAWTEINVDSPHALVVQISDRVVGKGMIAPAAAADPDADDAETKRRRNRMLDLAHICEVAAAGWKEIGLITYKATEKELARTGVLPINVTTGHFNKIRGQDHFRNVEALIVAGRTLPGASEVEFMTEGLFYAQAVEIKRTGKWGENMARVAVGGKLLTIATAAHVDPMVEAVRWQICEAELKQAVGRARAIRRTAVNPVEIIILTSVPVGPVDVMTTWEELVPSKWEIMVSRGFLTMNAADMAAAYPDLFSDRRAAENWRDRQPSGSSDRQIGGRTYSFPCIELLNRKRVCPQEIEYTPPGRGQKPRAALIPACVTDPAAFISARLDAQVRITTK
jgi:hypothetical protein